MMMWSIGKKAFSLIELLAAIAILSIGIVMVLQALSVTSRVTALCSDLASATFLGEDKMQEWQFKEKYGLITAEPSAAEEKTGKFTWQYVFNLDRGLNLYLLNSSVSWQRANTQEKINLNTYLDNNES